MKKLIILFCLIFCSCTTTKVDSVKPLLTLEAAKLDELVNKLKIEEDINSIMNNHFDYSYSLLDELTVSIEYEKQTAFENGYNTAKKEIAEKFFNEEYIKKEDVISLLKQYNLIEE